MCLPGNFHDETHGNAGVLVGAAEGIDNIELFVGEFLYGKVFHLTPHFFAHGVVVVFILFGSPPYGILRVGIHDNVFVFGGTAGVDAGHDVDGIELGELAFVVAGEAGVHLHLKQFLEGGIVVYVLYAGDTKCFEVFSDFFFHNV